MINNVVLTGLFKGFNNDNQLLLKMDNLENKKIVKIDINNNLKKKIIDKVKEDDYLGINGSIELNDIGKIIIIIKKLTILSKK